VDEVRASEEYAADASDLKPKEVDLAKQFVHAIADEFRPQEFTDHYRAGLEPLLAAKELVPQRATAATPTTRGAPKVVDIMDALKQSLAKIQEAKKDAARKPAAKAAPRRTKRRAS
jgi:DNA end-binding protein Ku